MAIAMCELAPELRESLKTFKFRKEKNIAAIMMKINKKTMQIVMDEEYEDTTIEELHSEIPEQQPRYVALSYVLNHDDGRVSYPLIFIFVSPQGASPELQMLYAGSKNTCLNEGKFTKELELRSAEDFTEEAILEALKR